ncbi:MAG: mechanosensitive ion channel family protein [Bacteroidetes bacterium]|nr:MAG: mechanosensitive ion channel family protein [Bacteroidota bacterium]
MNIFGFLKDFYKMMGFSNINAETLKSISLFVIILLFALIVNYLIKRIVVKLIYKVAKKTSLKYDDIILKEKVILYITHLIPAAIIHMLMYLVFNDKVNYPFDYQYLLGIVDNMIILYVYIILWLVIFALLNAFYEIYKESAIAKRVDIKGFLQLIKVIISIFFVILIVSVIVDKKPGAILAAFGAVAVALIFVFKDTLLGFVAGIQIAANNMLKPGDWISMPDMNTDGTVLEIGLTTCKIQNWDKTISTVPTYTLVTKPFANWRGMEESGGRRIKRSIFIDVSSIKFCDKEMIEKLKNFHLIKNYIEAKETEIKDYNTKHGLESGNIVNARRITNIGTFRKYIEHYLKEHPKLNKNLTILVRQLQVTSNGLPMEIYVFSSDQRWVYYEAIQSDIFDHIFSIIPEFDLKLYQNPTGQDFNRVFSNIK